MALRPLKTVKGYDRRIARINAKLGRLRVSLGRPIHPSLAWWALSKEAKDLLRDERMSGRFGGKPAQAPYWLVQEVGSPGAAVLPKGYIKKAMQEWRANLKGRVTEWILR